jgi:hypothetical protein
MTIQAIKTRMTKEIPEIDTVHANTGGMGDSEGMMGADTGPSMPGESRGGSIDDGDDEGPEAPF